MLFYYFYQKKVNHTTHYYSYTVYKMTNVYIYYDKYNKYYFTLLHVVIVVLYSHYYIQHYIIHVHIYKRQVLFYFYLIMFLYKLFCNNIYTATAMPALAIVVLNNKATELDCISSFEKPLTAWSQYKCLIPAA